MAVWPAGLPQKQFSPVTEKRQDAAIRSSMDTGTPKKRRRFTAAVREITIPIVLSMAEKIIFDTFYITTLKEGVLPFDWTDPNDDTTIIEYRFVKPSRLTKKAGEWKGMLSLEVLP